MQGFYDAAQYDYEVESLMEQEGLTLNEAMVRVDAMEKQDYEEFAQWKQEQDEIAEMEERELAERGTDDSWYEDQYDIQDF